MLDRFPPVPPALFHPQRGQDVQCISWYRDAVGHRKGGLAGSANWHGELPSLPVLLFCATCSTALLLQYLSVWLDQAHDMFVFVCFFSSVYMLIQAYLPTLLCSPLPFVFSSLGRQCWLFSPISVANGNRKGKVFFVLCVASKPSVYLLICSGVMESLFLLLSCFR